jgi:hypothetical protein
MAETNQPTLVYDNSENLKEYSTSSLWNTTDPSVDRLFHGNILHTVYRTNEKVDCDGRYGHCNQYCDPNLFSNIY